LGGTLIADLARAISDIQKMADLWPEALYFPFDPTLELWDVKPMNFLAVFSLSVCISFQALAQIMGGPEQQKFSGFLVRQGNVSVLHEERSGKKLRVIATSLESQKALALLKKDDYIVGYGSLRGPSELGLDTVEYVGLRKLLGFWIEPGQTIFNFENFKQVSVVNLNQNLERLLKKNYDYIVAPGDENSWKIFLSDENSVRLARLILARDVMSLELYDSDTGEVVQKMTLRRLRK
jgi:hypothetical protein